MILFVLLLLPLVFMIGLWVGARNMKSIVADIAQEYKFSGIEMAADWLRNNEEHIMTDIAPHYKETPALIKRLADEIETQFGI